MCVYGCVEGGIIQNLGGFASLTLTLTERLPLAQSGKHVCSFFRQNCEFHHNAASST